MHVGSYSRRAEIYIYNDHRDLSGSNDQISPGILHAVLANWLGRGGHPLGMESHPDEEKWNHPVYSFACSSVMRSDHQVVACSDHQADEC